MINFEYDPDNEQELFWLTQSCHDDMDIYTAKRSNKVLVDDIHWMENNWCDCYHCRELYLLSLSEVAYRKFTYGIDFE